MLGVNQGRDSRLSRVSNLFAIWNYFGPSDELTRQSYSRVARGKDL